MYTHTHTHTHTHIYIYIYIYIYQRCILFQKYINYFKIVRRRRVKPSKLRIDDPQILGTAIKVWSSRRPGVPDFFTPYIYTCYMNKLLHIFIICYLYQQMHIYIKILNYITNAPTYFSSSTPPSGSFDIAFDKVMKY
jgi:hypothetical protein